MEEAQFKWWAIMEKLQHTLRQAALCMFSRGQFNREQLHNYVMSGTLSHLTSGDNLFVGASPRVSINACMKEINELIEAANP